MGRRGGMVREEEQGGGRSYIGGFREISEMGVGRQSICGARNLRFKKVIRRQL